MNDDAVFHALADATRRQLLDRLYRRNGQTLGELCDGLEMTRQAAKDDERRLACLSEHAGVKLLPAFGHRLDEAKAPQSIRDPPACPMVQTIVDQVAALAEAPEVAQPVVARVMVQMRRRQDHPGPAHLHGFLVRFMMTLVAASALAVASCRRTENRQAALQ
jgi:hypothetical protein